MTLTAAELVKLIRAGSWLADAPVASLEKLAPLGQVRAYGKGKTVFQKGDDGDFMGIVLSGRLKISGFSVSGAETVHNILQPGDVAGEIAVLDGHPRTADAIAIEACELLAFSRAVVLRRLSEDAELAVALVRSMAGKLRAASDALDSMTLDMGRKVAAAMLRLAEQIVADEGKDGEYRIAIDQTMLARYAGITRSNLNRVLKRFEAAEASSHEKGVLTIRDIDWLRDFAESED
ncbi:MAG TPA: Crp/Fnr family transcriptional regulator [Hyphomonadaceae bacterium]|jgi:CRP-like cAMP-binding protein|nr:Crp/Fnr family transcriptional regulator [Hyphomonadaceae bacterium]